MKKHAILASAFCVLFVFPVLVLTSFVVYMSFRPIDITSFVKPFLPLVIMSEEGTGTPIATVDLQNAQLRWNGLRNGVHVPVSVALKNLTFSVTSTRFPNFIKEADVTFDPLALLNKSLKLRAVTITEAQLALRRDKNNRVGFDFNKPLPLPHHKKHTILDFSKLDEIHFEKTFLNWHEERNGTSWQLSDITADLYDSGRLKKQGIVGSASFNLASWNFPGLLLSLDARSLPYDKKSHKIRWSVLTNPVNPASLTSISPALADFNIPVSLESTFSLSSSNPSEWLLPDTSDLLLHFGSGYVHTLGSTYHIEQGLAKANLFIDLSHKKALPFNFSMPFFSLLIANPSAPHDPQRALALHLNGHANSNDVIHPQKINIKTELFIPHVDFRDIHQFWPNKAAKGGRRWVTNNITSGFAHNLTLSMALESNHGFKQLALKKIRGGLDAKHLSVHWLRPITPLREMDARLDITNPHSLLIHYGGGYEPINATPVRIGDHLHKDKEFEEVDTHRIAAGPGTMEIVNLQERVPTGIIKTRLSGDLGDVKKLLSEPRLHLLSRHPLSITDAHGPTDIDLNVSLPLSKHTSNETMSISARADIHNGLLGNAVAGHALHDSNLTLNVNKEEASLAGHGLIEHLPADVHYQRDFRPNPVSKTREKGHILLNITPDNADSSGIKLSDIFHAGHSKLDINYNNNTQHQSRVDFFYDLTNAEITTPVWKKREGQPASISTSMFLERGHISQIDQIKASGPAFDAVGIVNAKNPNKTEVTIPNFLIGQSQGQGNVLFFSRQLHDKIYVTLHAQKLVVPESTQDHKEPAPQRLANNFIIRALSQNNVQGKMRPWTVDLTADQILLKKTSLGSVRIFADNNGHNVDKMNFEIRNPLPLSVRMLPSRSSERSFHLFVPDLGEFLTDFKLAKNIKGGRLTLDGQTDDTQEPARFNGKLETSPFTLERAPTSVKSGGDVSLYGWLSSQLSSDEDNANFSVNYFSMPLTMENNIVKIHDATAGNTSLSATMAGYAFLQTNALECHGTVVPISSVNTLPGQIPGLGKLLSPEKNGGLFSITFRIDGTVQKPILHVNPFSLFAPGALRNM